MAKKPKKVKVWLCRDQGRSVVEIHPQRPHHRLSCLGRKIWIAEEPESYLSVCGEHFKTHTGITIRSGGIKQAEITIKIKP